MHIIIHMRQFRGTKHSPCIDAIDEVGILADDEPECTNELETAATYTGKDIY